MRLWRLRAYLSGWWLEKRCNLYGHELVRYSPLHQLWRCRCGEREETDFQFLQKLTRS